MPDADTIAALTRIRERFSAEPPRDLDPEVLGLCQAMNAFPGIFTIGSCCGHGREPFRIWFKAESLEALPDLLFLFDDCHTGLPGRRVLAVTDCGAGPVAFVAEGPTGSAAYEAAEGIAKAMREEIEAMVTEEKEGMS
jgi:hypothetical protein